jgi:hypothetical protein
LPFVEPFSCARPEGKAATLLIGAGDYHEKVNVTRKAPLTMLVRSKPLPRPLSAASHAAHSSQGQLPSNATWAIGVPAPAPLVHIWDNKYIVPNAGMDDADTAVLLVAPSYNASLIGAGTTGAPLQPLFGNADFKAYSIAFENRAVSEGRLWLLWIGC